MLATAEWARWSWLKSQPWHGGAHRSPAKDFADSPSLLCARTCFCLQQISGSICFAHKSPLRRSGTRDYLPSNISLSCRGRLRKSSIETFKYKGKTLEDFLRCWSQLLAHWAETGTLEVAAKKRLTSEKGGRVALLLVGRVEKDALWLGNRTEAENEIGTWHSSGEWLTGQSFGSVFLTLSSVETTLFPNAVVISSFSGTERWSEKRAKTDWYSGLILMELSQALQWVQSTSLNFCEWYSTFMGTRLTPILSREAQDQDLLQSTSRKRQHTKLT